jgi:hypothetical protein
LSQIQHPEFALEEMIRITRPGGRILITWAISPVESEEEMFDLASLKKIFGACRQSSLLDQIQDESIRQSAAALQQHSLPGTSFPITWGGLILEIV